MTHILEEVIWQPEAKVKTEGRRKDNTVGWDAGGKNCQRSELTSWGEDEPAGERRARTGERFEARTERGVEHHCQSLAVKVDAAQQQAKGRVSV